MLRVPVPGGALAVEDIGHGPPLVMLHGWTLDRRMWRPQVPELSKGYRLILIDRRGNGESTAPPDLAAEPDDVARVADTLQIDRFALLGMSQGGRVALAVARRYPERIAALIVQGAPLSDVVPDPAEREDIPVAQMAEKAKAGDLNAVRRLWGTHPIMRTYNAEARGCVHEILGSYAARDLIAPQTELPVTRAEAARIMAPSLILTGTREPAWRRKVAAVLKESMSDARWVEIADAGHLCNMDRPEAFNIAVSGFLGR